MPTLGPTYLWKTKLASASTRILVLAYLDRPRAELSHVCYLAYSYITSKRLYSLLSIDYWVTDVTIQQNLQIVRETLAAFNAQDMTGFVKHMADDVHDYMPGRLAPLRGPEAIREDNASFVTIFPDAQFTITNAFGQGRWICIQGFFEATHQGPFPVPGRQPIPPTGKRIRISQCMVVQIENGKIREIHEYFNHLDFVNQLGINP